ncbi:MAG: hypothetical protein MUE50_23510 [Pirellulaceae bacterium]|jgi:hypothetical protein|nr:hypothetical protein [Pirellulaceae bacterium]MCU0978851.1 hypothetical protein [Pirellulaceae bacterium]
MIGLSRLCCRSVFLGGMHVMELKLATLAVLTALAATPQPPILGAQPPQESAPSAWEASRPERLRFMKDQASEFSLFQHADPSTPLPLMPEPSLRYINLEANVNDGATFLWLDGTRPAAAISYSIRLPDDRVYREWTSFSPTPLECRRGGVALWSPATNGLLLERLDDAPVPAATQVQRLMQMRTLARRFSGARHNSRDDSPTELRLMPAPLYHYTAEASGVLGGALFVFVIGTDPELFLLLEAVRDTATSAAAWQYTLARMSSQKMTLRLDGVDRWFLPNIYREPDGRNPSARYGETSLGRFIPSPAASPRP